MPQSNASLRSNHVIYQIGAIHLLPEAVQHFNWRRVLLVCGRQSFEASGAHSMMVALRQGRQIHQFSEFSPNPDAVDLGRALAVLREFPADVVIGIGGGSSMDMAKLLCAYDGYEDGPNLLAAIRSGNKVATRKRGLCLVPTTSGSGSEATHFAVVYIGSEKFSIAGLGLRADLVVLDPYLARSGSPHQRACSGMDAVCQAIESSWAVNANTHSRRLARHALGLLLSNIEAFVHENTPRSACAMMIGSHLAGRAIDVSKTTAAHALSYAITKRHGLNHGHAVAVTLGRFIEAHADLDLRLQPSVAATTHQCVMTFILRALSARDGADARQRFEALLERIGLRSDLTSNGIATAAEREAIVASVNVERLANNPVVFSAHDLQHMLQ